MSTASDLPVWLELPRDAPWTGHRVELPALRCALDVPDEWYETDAPATDGSETSCEYGGDSPVEWLTVRHVTNEPGEGGELSNWVAGTLRAIGFPVIPPSRLLIDIPELVQWSETGDEAEQAAASALDVDEVRLYDGTARWGPPDEGHFLHFYVVLAERGRDAWNIALGFDSAALPSVPDELVARDDHSRAAVVLANLELR